MSFLCEWIYLMILDLSGCQSDKNTSWHDVKIIGLRGLTVKMIKDAVLEKQYLPFCSFF